MEQHSIPLDISVDGAEVSTDLPVEASTTEDGSAEITQLLSDMYAQQIRQTDMMVICCGLIIGIMLCSLVRWWR